MENQQLRKLETITLGGGCFWCTEAVFQQLKGVESVRPGYIGGQTDSPTYRAVCTGNTGHAEAVEVVFNPEEVSFATLLEVFFATHDPTTLNRQGNDVGTQYRSAVFYTNDAQQSTALNVISSLTQQQIFANPIVTEVTAAGPFYQAEDYHQDYFNLHGYEPYCEVVIHPKVVKFRHRFLSLLKPGPK